MKRTILVFGLIAGLIVSSIMTVSVVLCGENPNYNISMIIGYASMLLSFSFVFIGIKSFRDKYNNGSITFWQGFKTGLFIMLIASTFYVVAWMIDYNFFVPDFMDKYAAHVISDAQASGKSPAEMDEVLVRVNQMKEMYKSPVLIVVLTYLEILPVGIVASVVSALILKRKPKEPLAA